MPILQKLWHTLPSALRNRIRPAAQKLASMYGEKMNDGALHKEGLSNDVAAYWTRHNVTSHKIFASRAESLDYFHWRCDQYPGYLALMPVAGFDGRRVLDYGCGPGNDMIGFLEYSKPKRLVGADVSQSSLAESAKRLALHGGKAELVQIDAGKASLPFDDASFDYIHCSGVLQVVPDLKPILAEFRRILDPGGRARVMVYNRDSIWMHLYVAYILRYRDGSISPGLPIDEAFARSTDGPECPISRCHTFEEFRAEASAAGLTARMVGVACSLFEMQQLAREFHAACVDQRLERTHREFLLSLTYNEKLYPYYYGFPAGIDLVVDLTS